jgi:hypothetical protein
MLPSFRVACLLLLVSAPALLEAQINTASLSGLATDPGGAALPHVSVTATDLDTATPAPRKPTMREPIRFRNSRSATTS